MSLIEFFGILGSNKGLWIPIILVLGVIFINGWTDAPGAITASVSTGALNLKSGIILAAVFNFIGALVMGLLNTSVLGSVKKITLMIGGDNSLPILSAALISIILWAIAAWYFGIPTSESHALISGIFGAAIAYNGGLSGIDTSALELAVLGLVLSLPLGFFGGVVVTKIIELVSNGTKSEKNIKLIQRIGSGAMAFMHGAQDSQKFAGVFVAALVMSGEIPEMGSSPVWLTVLCSAVISLGTAVGGYRIIKRVGMDTVKLTPTKGLAADISASLCMLAASFFGVPVSTTHTATASVIGAGMSSKGGKINVKSIKEMLIAWALTFPCCGLISFLAVKIYMFFS